MRPAHGARLLPLAAALSLLCPPGPAQAQQAADGSIETAPFQDRIIDPARLAELPPDDRADYDPAGLPRSFSAEAIFSLSEVGEDRFSESGLGFDGLWETERYGILSLDATLFHSDRDRLGNSRNLGLVTLWQRGLAFDGGWRADNGLGVLNTGLPSLLAGQYRFFLPSVPFAGASTAWRRLPGDTQAMASFGRGGVFTGSRVVGFDRAEGDVASAAVQWQWAPGWTSAVAVLRTGGRIVPDEFGGSGFQQADTDAVLAGSGWDAGDRGLNLFAQASRTESGHAGGAWADGWFQAGRFDFRYGLFHLEPGLAWGSTPINSDASGAYFRASYQHARWSWNTSVDAIRSVSGDSFDGLYANLFTRYQARANLSYGANLSVRDGGAGQDYSTRLFADRRSRLGLSRLQLDYAGGDQRERDWQLSLDQELPMRQGQRLSLAASYGSVSYDAGPATETVSVSAYGGFDLGERLNLDGNLRLSRGTGSGAQRSTDANVSLNWRVASHWWLATTLYASEGKRRSPFVLDPLAPPDLMLDLPRNRSLFLTLRYERQSGSSQSILGGARGSAYGSVGGSVFLDENGDGARSASEQAAANVTVLLDGLYAVRTDSQGRFDFPRVAVGEHQLTVVPDNLPLPWFLDAADEQRRLTVTVRDRQQVDIGARRQR